MTRKDYELIAKQFGRTMTVIKNFGLDSNIQTVCNLAHDLADSLQKDNPHFDSARFLKACGATK